MQHESAQKLALYLRRNEDSVPRKVALLSLVLCIMVFGTYYLVTRHLPMATKIPVVFQSFWTLPWLLQIRIWDIVLAPLCVWLFTACVIQKWIDEYRYDSDISGFDVALLLCCLAIGVVFRIDLPLGGLFAFFGGLFILALGIVPAVFGQLYFREFDVLAMLMALVLGFGCGFGFLQVGILLVLVLGLSGALPMFIIWVLYKFIVRKIMAWSWRRLKFYFGWKG